MLPRVLVVEDDEAIREIYALKFQLEGFTIAVAENGQAALNLVNDFHPHIVLLDMMMPIMDGHEFLRRLGPRVLEMDIIVFSNVSAPGQLEAARRLGARDYWVKSDFTPERVAAKLVERWRVKTRRTPRAA